MEYKMGNAVGVGGGFSISGAMSSHPYYPRSLVLPNYVAPSYPLSLTLGGILTVVGLLVTAASLAAHSKGLPVVEGMIFTWLILSGFVHCTLQAYFVLFHRSMASDNFIIAQMWKEYAKCDSRYVTSNTLLWCSEVIMLVFVGPMCFYTSYLVYVGSVVSHLYLAICSLCHLLVTGLYMLTSMVDGNPGCAPQRYYFWVYFVSSNSPWIFLPAILLARSVHFLHQALLGTK
ncbi:hypothetical protein K493DRAFT_366133 [Basidiobolus meristosporus CBS 931.73]|uniref:EXPERA domain-containing protein n=1 Tax=Basidiobolus meristosporus CBS 931.73 TaxID=1314790 RepID=A0A1Y1YM20_9FUNG|nr:hypothetical protein K493DRAFT_366133 [Basidiobolus meristosporus CBS 931.73]|eukprot:ORX99052.1 hypothetical protein K493DRAFT_366133 [Basidiobolus meristosporus CBS 931.73]